MQTFIPKFNAQGGTVDVGRQAAAYIYGGWDVRYPTDTSHVTGDERVSPGYIYRIPQAAEEKMGLFGRTFVRADAVIDLQEKASTVEKVIIATEKRVSGDLFFERDIPRSGLGINENGKDFTIGQTAHVEVFGKFIALPITKISQGLSKDGRTIDVHVGGKLTEDAAALDEKSSQVEKAIMAERKKTEKTVSGIKTAVSSVKTTADQAAADVTDLKNTVSTISTDLSQAILDSTAINEDLKKITELSQGALDEARGWSVQNQERLNSLNQLFQQRQVEWNALTDRWKEQVNQWNITQDENQRILTETVNQNKALQDKWNSTTEDIDRAQQAVIEDYEHQIKSLSDRLENIGREVKKMQPIDAIFYMNKSTALTDPEVEGIESYGYDTSLGAMTLTTTRGAVVDVYITMTNQGTTQFIDGDSFSTPGTPVVQKITAPFTSVNNDGPKITVASTQKIVLPTTATGAICQIKLQRQQNVKTESKLMTPSTSGSTYSDGWYGGVKFNHSKERRDVVISGEIGWDSVSAFSPRYINVKVDGVTVEQVKRSGGSLFYSGPKADSFIVAIPNESLKENSVITVEWKNTNSSIFGKVDGYSVAKIVMDYDEYVTYTA